MEHGCMVTITGGKYEGKLGEFKKKNGTNWVVLIDGEKKFIPPKFIKKLEETNIIVKSEILENVHDVPPDPPKLIVKKETEKVDTGPTTKPKHIKTEDIPAITLEPHVDISELKAIVHERIKSSERQQKALKWLLRPCGSEGKAKGKGYVYVYVKEGQKNMCKVGCTEKTVQERTRRWQTKCGFKIECKYSSEAILPYCEACERLIHYELKDKGMWRDQPKCSGCNQRHVEWFEGEPKTIIDVDKFWEKVIRLAYEE